MAEIYVTSTADSGAGSLRQAMHAAQDGDVILFDPDVFPTGQTTSILLSSYLIASRKVSIYGGESDGNGGYTSGTTKQYFVYRDVYGVKTKVYIDENNPAMENEPVLFELVCRVAIDGQNTTRIFYTSTGEKSWFGIQFKNAYNATYGGCFSTSNDAVLNLIECSINDCNAHDGAVLYSIETSENVLIDCSIDNCNATTLGGVIYAVGSSGNILNNCSISNCSASSGGAAYFHQQTVNVLNGCVIYGCDSSTGGGIFTNGTSQNTLNDCTISGCSAAASGGVVYSGGTSQNTLTDCIFDGCRATNGGGVFSANTSQNTLNACTITGCSANYGGGVFSANTSQNTLNACVITNCVANAYAGGVCVYSESQAILNGCTISDCTADTRGGGLYALNTSQATLNNCVITGCHANLGGGTYFDNSGGTSIDSCAMSGNISSGSSKDVLFDNSAVAAISATQFGYYYSTAKATITFANGVTTIATPRIDANATITIADGAALTITTSAIIGAATFSSEGRGYLAVASGINVSAATLTNVVLCAYGADVSSFAEVDGVLEWEAANPTTTVLIERADGDSWSTVTQTAGESLTLYLPPSDTVRLFDGVQFFSAQTPAVRTYYYIGGAEGSFTSAADWSLRRGGVAITEPPVVAGQRFIVGDIEDAQEE